MTTQLVKKFGGKRKGYSGSKWDTAKTTGKYIASTGGGLLAWDAVINALRALGAGKDGGRVTKRGIGKARRGLGKVMGKK